MTRYIFIVLLAFSFSAFSQDRNELAIYVSPIAEIDMPTSYKLLYKRQLAKPYQLRVGISAFADLDKEVRNDSTTLSEGSFQYNLSIGCQRQLKIDGLKKVQLYAGSELYYDSEFNRKQHETYYGYYWNFGVTPLVGISYNPFKNIRLALEGLGDINVNLQDYSAPGENIDRRLSILMMDRLAVSLGYLF